MMSDRMRTWVRTLADLVAVATALGMIASYFPRDLMFSTTITNGGDMASHFYPAVYLRDTLLPKGQVTGWCPGNYCGFPLFQFYFPLPFVGVALLGKLIPITVVVQALDGLRRLPAAGLLLPRAAARGHSFSRSRTRRPHAALLPLHGGELHVGR